MVPSKLQQASVTGNVLLLTRSPLPSVAMAAASVVVSGGFRPQVEFGAICLDLPPDGKDAEPDQGKQ
jgi:hypothetical protein